MGNERQRFDGGVDLYAPSWDVFEKAFQDPYYLSAIREDEQKFVDISSWFVLTGHDYVVMDNS